MKSKILSIFYVFLFFHWGFSFELIQIHTITRHGERSPCFSYPSDPYKSIWTKGLGQLTPKGVDQLKEVGTFLRNYYRTFLPINFHKKEFYIRSSDTDRTISSALAAMGTLFNNEIVPVHTVPKSYDYLLKMTSNCPYHKKLLSKEFKSEKYTKIIAEYLSFFKELETHTGLQSIDIHMALRICDSITVWNQLKLTFPDWVNVDSVKKCKSLGDLKFIISYSNNLLTKYRGGPLASNIVDNMIKRATSFVTDKTGLKMIGFFTHDSTISAFLSHLGSFNRAKPPLASTVIVELYHDSQSIPIDDEPLSQFFVRLLFRNDTNIPPHILDISVCRNKDGSVGYSNGFCRLDLLRNSLESHTVKDLARECGLSNIIDYWFASNDQMKHNLDSLVINDGELKSSIPYRKYESDLLVNILFPLLLVEILVLFLFYRVFRR